MAEKPISNEEIEALMEAVQTGTVNEKGPGRPPREVKDYDFARPDKFSKEQLRTLEMIQSNCARGLTTQFSTLMRSQVEVELTSIAEITYLDYFESLQETAAISLIGIEPLVGRALLEFDPELSFVLIDRLLGGPGRPPSTLRELTEIEKGLMERAVSRVLKGIADSWSTLIPLKPQLEMVIGSALFGQVALPDDRMVLARFSMKLATATGNLSFGIPVSAMDPVLSKLNAQQWFSSGRQTSNDAHETSIRRALDGADLEVAAVLGQAEVTVRDLLDLQVGDLVCLNRQAGAELDVLVGSEVKYRGQPGQVGRRLGVQITQVLNGEE